jgi:hypothetical protein
MINPKQIEKILSQQGSFREEETLLYYLLFKAYIKAMMFFCFIFVITNNKPRQI